ncbi:hypothetical protein [Aquirufa ecclesiirivi]|uniref:hypothetical protein n=1 Tax=Aquirufa ecclesiirivi TaxID=2715124 RepID=UPI003BAE6A02
MTTNNIKVESNSTQVNTKTSISVPALRSIGFEPVHRARKMSLRGKEFTYVIENKHVRGDQFEFELVAPVVKKIQFIDQIQDLFHALEGIKLEQKSNEE